MRNMHGLSPLIKRAAKSHYHMFVNFKAVKNDPARRKKIPIIFLSVLMLVYLAFIGFIASSAIFKAAVTYDLLPVMTQILFLILALFILFMDIPYLYKSVSTGEGNQLLMSMPMRVGMPALAEVVYLIITGVITMLVLLVPGSVVQLSAQPLNLLLVILNIILLSISVTLLASILLIWISSRSAFLYKHGRVIQVIALVVFLIFIMGTSFSGSYFGAASANQDGEAVNGLIGILMQYKVVLSALSILIFPVFLAVQSVAQTSVAMKLLFLLVHVLLAYGLYWVLNRKVDTWVPELYALRDTVKMGQEASVRKRHAKKGGAKDYRQMPVYRGLMKKEFKDLLRNPMYLFNYLAGGFVLIIILGFQLFMLDRKTGELSEGIYQFLGQAPVTQLILISLGLGFFMSALTASANTSFSREGKQIWMMQVLPISEKDQVISRILSGVLVSSINGIFIAGLVLYLTKNPLYFFVTLFGTAYAAAAENAAALIVDINNPKTNWSNPQEAIKQNMNQLWGMIAMLPGNLVIFGVSALTFFTLGTLATIIVYLVLVAIVFVVWYKIDCKTLRDKLRGGWLS